MTDDRANLIEALTTADKLRGFLANLDKLKADGSITGEQHTAVKADYDGRLGAALSEIAGIKGELKKQLEKNQRDIEASAYELRRLEVRYKIEELPVEEYLAADRKMRAQVNTLEVEAQELKKLINAQSSADIDTEVKKPVAVPSRAAVPSKIASVLPVAAPSRAASPSKIVNVLKAGSLYITSKLLNRKRMVIAGAAGVALIIVVGIVLGVTLGSGREIPREGKPDLTSEIIGDLEAQINTTQQAVNQRTDKTKALLVSSGLPVTGIYFEPTTQEKQVLLIALDFAKLEVGSKPGSFITSAVQSLVKIAGIKTLDLSGITYVTVVLKDSKGRIIIKAGAQSSDIDAFRTGKIAQKEFIKRSVAQVEDRFAAFDAMKK